MKKIVFFVMLLMFLSLNGSHAQTNYLSSTVRVYATIGDNRAKQGTGFVTRLNNRNYIVTCYHVISGSDKIEAFSLKIGNIGSIKIVGIDADRDIAILEGARIDEVQPISLSNTSVSTNISAKAIGNPNNISEQEFPVNFTYPSGFIKAYQLRDSKGNSVYKTDASFDLIPFTIPSIYSGMSGSPIIVNNQSVGFISGSLNIGGSLSWAIPAKYIQAVNLRLRLDNGKSLRPSTAFENNFYRSFVINREHLSQFEPVTDILEELKKRKDDIILSNTFQNRNIDKLLEVINQVKSYGLSEQSMNTIKRLYDSVIYHNTAALTAYNGFISNQMTFNQIFQKLTEAFSNDEDAQEIDPETLDEVGKPLKELANVSNINQTKYKNKQDEVKWAKALIPYYIYTPSDIVDKIPSWINYLNLMKQEGHYLVEVVKIEEQGCLVMRRLIDLLAESLMYDSSN